MSVSLVFFLFHLPQWADFRDLSYLHCSQVSVFFLFTSFFISFVYVLLASCADRSLRSISINQKYLYVVNSIWYIMVLIRYRFFNTVFDFSSWTGNMLCSCNNISTDTHCVCNCYVSGITLPLHFDIVQNIITDHASGNLIATTGVFQVTFYWSINWLV